MHCSYHRLNNGNIECYVKIQKGEEYIWIEKVIKRTTGSTVTWALEKRKFSLKEKEDVKEYNSFLEKLKPMARSRFQKVIKRVSVNSSLGSEDLALLKSLELLERITSFIRKMKETD